MAGLIFEQHQVSGHIGRDRLFSELVRRYALPDIPAARKICEKILRSCEVCQASDHLHTSPKVTLKSTLVPPVPMDNVAIDVFYMDPVKYDGVEFDCFVLIVDRHSGWVTAFPEHRVGLTAKRVARQAFLHHWDFLACLELWCPTRDPNSQPPFGRPCVAFLGYKMLIAMQDITKVMVVQKWLGRF